MNKLKCLPLVEARWFWQRVSIEGPDECWPWMKYTGPRGYGFFTKKGIGYRAHRVALWLSTGEDCPELLACHTCDNPRCCNPAHLYWGTQKDNMRDRSERGRVDRKIGINNPRAKLDPQKVLEIRALAKDMTITELARRYGVNRKAIWMVVNNVTWKEVGVKAP